MAESLIAPGFAGDGFPREPVVTVSELNRSARMLLERGFAVSWVTGELSNLVRHASGHWYFTLKDAQAQVRCVMFRHRNQLLDWRPENGMQVDVRALVTLYEPRGDFQLGVEAMRRAGLGALFEAFQRLKERLESEGLFDAARKRPLPDFPRCVGVVTSPGAAALRDVLTTLRRRMPSLPVIVYPAQVQGEGAAQQIASALAAAGERRECDVIVLCRGGGSLEDLWAFNEEAVARAIRACPVPVVSGVGHETDFTIADFAADRRAPTPTAAAELASPNREELEARLRGLGERLSRAAGRGLEQRMQQVDYLSRRLQHPGTRLERQRSDLAHLRERLRGAMARVLADREGGLGQQGLRLRRAAPALALLEARRTALGDRLRRAGARRLDDAAARLRALGASLEHLSPQQVLERGYAIVRDSKGTPVRDSTGLEVGQDLGITFARGSAGVTVRNKDSGG